MVTVDYGLGGDAFLVGGDGDGDAVLVGAADVDDILALEPFEADVEVCREIDACKMTEVDRAICVGKGCGDEGTYMLHVGTGVISFSSRRGP
ncbi:hypothetical protein Ptc2401_00791 [Prosthecochloris sp. CIB 2401]|nr:hypothetical protein Ptc2401_00791 [Prosthecochloris sp. CIB 2401]